MLGNDSMSAVDNSGELFRLPKRVALADTVADSIASAISAGYFEPGQRLSEMSLAEQTGVSRVPIREALKILSAQGIVTGEQNRGYRVAPFDDKTVQNVLEVRLALETILLRDAILQWRANGDRASLLEGPLQRMRDAARDEDRAASLAADLDFHRAVANASANEICRVLWEALARHVLIIFSRQEYRDDDLVSVVAQHERFRDTIVEMIESDADAETIKLRLETHLLQVKRNRADARAAKA